MKLQVEVPIQASKEAIWSTIADIENATENISGIEKVEVLEKPEKGLVGLKWVETRTFFGKTATETMWITEAEENNYYQTRAESNGAIYISRLQIEDKGGTNHLSMSFSSEPQSFVGKVMGLIFSSFFKKSMKKMVLQDLEDIKAVSEKR